MFVIAVLFICCAAAPLTVLYAKSATATKTSGTTTKKASADDDERINVPEAALKPRITKKEVEDLLKKYVNAFTEPDMPATLKQYKENPEKYTRITKSRAISNIRGIANFIRDARVSGVNAVNPDILEVTATDPSWFLQIYEAAKKVETPATAMDKALSSGSETAYVAALKAYKDAVNEVTDQLRVKPTKLDSAKLKALVESNQKRRREAYIEGYKKLVEDKAAELDRQQKAIEEANKKASSATKSTGK